MSTTRKVIALVGVGNVGKYLCEELIASKLYDVVVISRNGSEWLRAQNVPVKLSDYSETSVLSILNDAKATALISFVNCHGNLFVNIHCSFLRACANSQTCKRLIPSEWVGNIEEFPGLPSFYASSREPFRKILKSFKGVEWTLFNGGWLMDYFLPKEKTYLAPIPDEFPVDPNNWRACIRGTGDEIQAFTSAREIALAVVELLGAPKWDPVTYVVGEWTTFNNAIKILEGFYKRRFEVSYKSEVELIAAIKEQKGAGLGYDVDIAEWTIAGASACPREKTLLQRDKFFSKIKFSTIPQLLKQAEGKDSA